MSLFKKKTPNVEPESNVEPNVGSEKDENDENEVDIVEEETSSDEDTEEQAETPEETDATADKDSIETDDPVTLLAAGIISEMKAGGLSDDTRAMLTKALNYDADMLRAEAEGELRGRNAAIEEHLQTQEQGDGVPHPSCGPGASQQATCYSIFDLARNAR